ncbi:MAG: hypothetical protein WCK88_00460 [bacterium]
MNETLLLRTLRRHIERRLWSTILIVTGEISERKMNSRPSMRLMPFYQMLKRKLVMTNSALLMEVHDLVEWVDLILEISMLRTFLALFLGIWVDLVDNNELREKKEVRIYNMIFGLPLQRVILE